MKLYEIGQEYQMAFNEITDVLSDSDLTTDEVNTIVRDSLAGLQDAFEQKALAVGKYIATLDFEVSNLDEMIKRLTARKRSVAAKHDSFKEYLFNEMQRVGVSSIKDASLVLTIKNNPAKVIVLDADVVPDEYRVIKTEMSIAKSAISSALKAGVDVPGVMLEGSQRLDIK